MSYIIIHQETIWYEGVSHEDCKQAMLSVPDNVEMEIVHEYLWDFVSKCRRPVVKWHKDIMIIDEWCYQCLPDGKLLVLTTPDAVIELIFPATYIIIDKEMDITVIELFNEPLTEEIGKLHKPTT